MNSPAQAHTDIWLDTGRKRKRLKLKRKRKGDLHIHVSGDPDGVLKAALSAEQPNAPDAVEKAAGEFEYRVPLVKDDARQLVYGVVLTPGLRDSQDDEVAADDVEKAAHAFLVEYRKHDIQHDEQPADVQTVESYVAPCDFELNGERVLKGSWVLVTHVADPQAWERVMKGEITGYSIGGSGVRLPDEQ